MITLVLNCNVFLAWRKLVCEKIVFILISGERKNSFVYLWLGERTRNDFSRKSHLQTRKSFLCGIQKSWNANHCDLIARWSFSVENSQFKTHLRNCAANFFANDFQVESLFGPRYLWMRESAKSIKHYVVIAKFVQLSWREETTNYCQHIFASSYKRSTKLWLDFASCYTVVD